MRGKGVVTLGNLLFAVFGEKVVDGFAQEFVVGDALLGGKDSELPIGGLGDVCAEQSLPCPVRDGRWRRAFRREGPTLWRRLAWC
jgi:hypothetical protein